MCYFGGLAEYFDDDNNRRRYSNKTSESEKAWDKSFSNLVQELVLFIVGGVGVTGAKVWKAGGPAKGSLAGVLFAAAWAAQCADFIDSVYIQVKLFAASIGDSIRGYSLQFPTTWI